jgi:hypothetical protein
MKIIYTAKHLDIVLLHTACLNSLCESTLDPNQYLCVQFNTMSDIEMIKALKHVRLLCLT